MLIDDLKQRNLEAIRNRDSIARNILGIVINKWMILEREVGEIKPSDTDMIKIIQKTVKELTDEANNYSKVGNLEEVEIINHQKAVLAQYLPKLLNEDEIKEIILKLEDKSIPKVMEFFGTHYKENCDRSIVLKVLKEM